VRKENINSYDRNLFRSTDRITNFDTGRDNRPYRGPC
jgi:hypothetical protein